MGGDGHDTLTAGAGTDSIFGASGNSTIIGSYGRASIYAGSGNDRILGVGGTYFIDGGSGRDTISGGTGSHDSIYGGTGGHNLIYGSTGGYDLIYGGGPNGIIYGGTGGHDTIYGGAGGNPNEATNKQIYGGDGGFNLIYGAGSGDLLFGAVPTANVTYGGNNTLYGGTGNETLYGGDGQALHPDPSGSWAAAGDGQSNGNNLLIAGNGNGVVLFSDANGHNTLQAGSGTDTLWAGMGGDYLAAGSGVDALYGGPGDDSFQLHFTASGQQPDTVVGGPGLNTIVLKPDTVQDASLLAAIPDTTSTSIRVTDPTVFAGNGITHFVIQVDSEQMLVTSVSGNTLTAQRGYHGTTPATHSAGAAVVVENPTLASAIPNPTVTTLTVTDGAALGGNGAANFVIQVDREQMLVRSISGNTVTMQRGYNQTTATTHNAGAFVFLATRPLSQASNYKLFFTQDNGSSNVVDIYDASKPPGQQSSTAALSQARGYLTATTVGTKALFAGGWGLLGSATWWTSSPSRPRLR